MEASTKSKTLNARVPQRTLDVLEEVCDLTGFTKVQAQIVALELFLNSIKNGDEVSSRPFRELIYWLADRRSSASFDYLVELLVAFFQIPGRRQSYIHPKNEEEVSTLLLFLSECPTIRAMCVRFSNRSLFWKKVVDDWEDEFCRFSKMSISEQQNIVAKLITLAK